MSDYHVLESIKNDRVRVAFHVAVPSETNVVGVNLQTAVSQYLSGQAIVTEVPWLEAEIPAEYAQIQNGEVYEHVEIVEYDANLSVGQKQTEMDNRFAMLTTVVVNTIRDILKFWGHNRDVP